MWQGTDVSSTSHFDSCYISEVFRPKSPAFWRLGTERENSVVYEPTVED